MDDFLNNLRKKPEEEKQSIALGTAGILTVIIFAVWIVYFTNRLDNIETSTEISDDTASFVDQLQEGIGIFQENLEELQSDTEEIILEDGEVFIEQNTSN
ncbi:MAG: hypothetical protein QF858_01420 [Candidatus Pacebacteria bacterium]|jgi:hypothetical protein|nr:hypothetical protein [bacterium]MDP6527524.1 hypothetical protein [Candidatus Paceibacterota bacterium]MDP6659879.1 hypothetical protein [Candidatus Paceibacterota bacterium]|tara:strand:+ start:27441 stop:27740 length:300 start_codon:yes stop_codon:yes gene_type:complete